MSPNKPISLAHLSSISWDELGVRTQQGILKRWDSALYDVGLRRSLNGPVVSRQQGRWQAADRSQACFLWNSSDLPQLLTIMREKLPHEVERTIEDANRIC